jgi:alkanesulfonate monooxygenase SsuD/methylene tetrahydromethanopterin reductase-like flavin-dependent oxidoreductase (luciferase family)
MRQPSVPIWVAATGPRMLSLTDRYANGWNIVDRLGGDRFTFRSRLADLERACEQLGRNPAEIDISCLTNVLVLPDQRAAASLVERIGAATGWTGDQVRDRYVIGTPDEVVRRLVAGIEWGIDHYICSLGVRPFTLWSDAQWLLPCPAAHATSGEVYRRSCGYRIGSYAHCDPGLVHVQHATRRPPA